MAADRDPPELETVRDPAVEPPVEPADPSRRPLIVGFVFVVLLVTLGYVVVDTMISTASLQDCAATGRRDC